ncbi:FecR family protein [Gemmatimonas sp.]|uniref:FecR family protein n=1 Tax=Gemmatimonas sp. TaxID=1962908 RepID=UPI003DA32F8E
MSTDHRSSGSDRILQDLALERSLVDAMDRMLSNEGSQQDEARVQAWLSSAPSHSSLWEFLQAEYANAADTRDGATDAAWLRLRARISDGVASPVRPVHDSAIVGTIVRHETPTGVAKDVPRQRWVRRMAAAAVFVSAALAGNEWIARLPVSVTATQGQRVTVTLPDGSTMILAAGSRATWPRRFTGAERGVALTGEAFFDVVHDTDRPFRVRVRDAVAEDVGTRFLVKGWPELANVEVAVHEGIVALSDSASGVARPVAARTQLRAGQRGRLLTDGTVRVASGTDAELSWLRGELYFADAPLREVLPVLSRWYGVTLTADSTLLDRRLTARFVTQPFPQLLESLQLALGLGSEQRGTTFTLVPAP